MIFGAIQGTTCNAQGCEFPTLLQGPIELVIAGALQLRSQRRITLKLKRRYYVEEGLVDRETFIDTQDFIEFGPRMSFIQLTVHGRGRRSANAYSRHGAWITSTNQWASRDLR